METKQLKEAKVVVAFGKEDVDTWCGAAQTFSYIPFCLLFNSWSYYTCIALMKQNSIKVFIMQLLRLLDINRLVSPGNSSVSVMPTCVCPLWTAMWPSQIGRHRAHRKLLLLSKPLPTTAPDGIAEYEVSWRCLEVKKFFPSFLNRKLPSNHYPAHWGETRPHISMSVPIMKSSLTKIRTYIPD